MRAWKGTPGLMSNDYLFIFVPHELQTPCDAEIIFKFDFFYSVLNICPEM